VLVLELAAHVGGVWLITDKSERRYVDGSRSRDGEVGVCLRGCKERVFAEKMEE
jgi:hypothetical protein